MLPTAPAPDLALARRALSAQPPPGRLLLCGLTGSHAYGFPSPDSDLDLKGVHLAPTAALLGLDSPPESYDEIFDFEGTEIDVTTQEARKALSLLLTGNGNLLERILSPLQVIDTPWVAALQDLARGAICRRFARHYQGFFHGRCKEHDRAAKPTAKNLLYAYRVALTGAHLLRAGALELDLSQLAAEAAYPTALELIALKRQATETATVPAALDAAARADWPRLARGLQSALAASHLPEFPPSAADCHHWLVATRLSFG